MKQLPNVEIKPDYLPLQGGLDLVAQESLRAPGTLGDCLNYEPDIDGGYRRILGYERFSGKTRPSSATPLPVACTLTSTPAAGSVVTIGATSGIFIAVITGGILLANATGAAPASTNMTVSASSVGTTATDTWPAYEVTPAIQAQWYVDCAAYYRTLIAAVPGAGPVRGVWQYLDTVYAIRDNVGLTASVMYKSSSSGWTVVSFGEEVAFSNANTSVGETDVLTQGAVTATIMRVLVETGSLLSGTNTGRLIISGRAGGAYAAGAATSTGGGTLTLSGAQSAITFAPGGRYRFRNWNFSGQASTLRVYGVSGVGRAFEFDGTTLAPISTGLSLALDMPAHIETAKGRLWLALRSSLLYSAPGQPVNFSAAATAGEAAVGADITALRTLPGKVLGVFTRNSTLGFYGSSSADFSLDLIAPESGAISGIVGMLTRCYALDDRGLMDLQTAQEYGNFTYSTVSKRIQPLITAAKSLAIDAVVLNSKDQFRMLLSDGRSLVMYPRTLQRLEFTLLQYSMLPFVACASEDSTGTERYFIGAQDGFVYEMDRGSTFDGGDIEAFIKTNYHNGRSPRVDKTYRGAILEMTASLYVNLSYFADYSFSQRGNSPSSGAQEVAGTGSAWDVAAWDTMLWDSPNVAAPRLQVSGTGVNVSYLLYSKTKLDPGHAVQGITSLYTPRKLNRGY